MKRIGIVRAGMALALLGLALSQGRADKVDDWVRTRMELRKVPGVSIAVVREGKVVKTAGYGQANVELEVPATDETVYQLASVTKQFTATGIMMLLEEGKLSLEDPVSKFVDNLPTAWSGVTLRHLLNHTSGIKSYTDTADIATQFRKDMTHADIIKLAASHPMDFQPGEKWHYNNTGFFLLGMVIEKVSGKPYEVFLKERIFDPLEMKSTRLNVNQDIIKKRATGYTSEGGTLRNGDYVSATQPFAAGALVSTVKDMAKWDAALYTEKLLKKSSLEKMWTPTTLKDGKAQNYGFGWSIENHNGHKQIGHGGGIPGFSTYIGRYVDDKLTVIVLTNADGGSAEGLARGIAALYIPEIAAKEEKAVASADPKVVARLRTLLESVIADKLDLQQFTEEARKPVAAGAPAARNLLKSLGELKKIEVLGQEEQGGMQITRFRVTFAKETLRATLGLTKDDKIGAIGLSPGE